MKSGKVAHVQYQKTTNHGGREGEVTERYIIPTYVPTHNIKAIDVTDLTEEEQKRMENLLAEYQEYVDIHRKSLATFEDWVTHSHGEDEKVNVKWRTFNMNYLDLLD